MARLPPAELSREDRRLWARVSGTVTPPRSRKPHDAEARPTSGGIQKDASEIRPKIMESARASPRAAPPAHGSKVPVRSGGPVAHSTPEALEPRRQRRLARGRDPIEATLDLHGYSRFEAEDALRRFLAGARARGLRSVLVVTGQGRRGGGVIRASIQEWLQSQALRGQVSGFAVAHRRHGGEGAIYVTLRRG